MFNCDKCGICCTKLKLNMLYKHLDRGDGICKYFNEKTKLCNIYINRPLLCNIDEAYLTFFKNKMSIEDYYQKNYQICEKLKMEMSEK